MCKRGHFGNAKGVLSGSAGILVSFHNHSTKCAIGEKPELLPITIVKAANLGWIVGKLKLDNETLNYYTSFRLN
jgi:hypothetical protein